MNFFPDSTPRSRPDARIFFLGLNDAVINKDILNLLDRRPKGRFCRVIACKFVIGPSNSPKSPNAHLSA
jgi:hypothetical protein